MGLVLVPITLREACAFVALHYRHHKPPRGCRFVVGAADDGAVVGVAIVEILAAHGIGKAER